MTLPTEDVVALVAYLQNVLTDWNGADIPDAELPRVDVLCGTLRLAATALSTLAGERDGHQSEVLGLMKALAAYTDRALVAEARATAAEARIAGLEAALEPFARRIDEIEQVKAIAKFSVEGTAAVKLADLRRAREALSRQEGGR